MRNLRWDRSARITEVRDRIWSYVSPSSQFEVAGAAHRRGAAAMA